MKNKQKNLKENSEPQKENKNENDDWLRGWISRNKNGALTVTTKSGALFGFVRDDHLDKLSDGTMKGIPIKLNPEFQTENLLSIGE